MSITAVWSAQKRTWRSNVAHAQLTSASVILAESVENAYEILCADIFYRGINIRFVVKYRTPLLF